MANVATLRQDTQARSWLERRVDRSKYERSTEFAVQIDPALADVMLERNEGNRRASPTHVSVLSESLKRGEWIETGDGIKFDRNGRLLDGQHRLMAIRSSGVTVKMDVHFGIAPEAFDRIDVGKTRTASTILEIGGHKNTTCVASAARILIALNRGVYHLRNDCVSRHQIALFVADHPALTDAATLAGAIRDKIGKVRSVGGIAAAAFLIGKSLKLEGETFFEKLKTGVGFKNEFDPVLALRNRLARVSGSNLEGMEVTALTIKAFNFWREEKSAKVLVWRAADEVFPKVGS